MRVFVLRARKGPTSPSQVDASWGDPNHFEIIANSIASALFISKHIRPDVEIYIALEGPPDPPKMVSFHSTALFHLGGFDEKTIASAIKQALDVSIDLSKEEIQQAKPGLFVSRMSFEKLVRNLSNDYPLFFLNKKGEDVRNIRLPGNACFLLTDHISMQKKTLHLLKRLGVKKVSLGPTMLFAAHCIVLAHNELDRIERDGSFGR